MAEPYPKVVNLEAQMRLERVEMKLSIPRD